jgi:hypothetical protein
MLAFLALLPRVLVTFLYALAALLRFFADGPFTPPASAGRAQATALLGWSLTAFVLASAALLADLGLECHRGNGRREREAQRRERQGVRLSREASFRMALAGFLLDPGEASRRRLSRLIGDER